MLKNFEIPGLSHGTQVSSSPKNFGCEKSLGLLGQLQKSLGHFRDFELWHPSLRNKNLWDWQFRPMPIPGSTKMKIVWNYVSKYLILTSSASYRELLFKRSEYICHSYNNWNLWTGELTKIVSNFHFRWDQLWIYKELRLRIFTPYCFQQW